jgi:hypothetical protein
MKDENFTTFSLDFPYRSKLMRRSSGEQKTVIQFPDFLGWSDLKVLEEDHFLFPLFSDNHQTYLNNKKCLTGTTRSFKNHSILFFPLNHLQFYFRMLQRVSRALELRAGHAECPPIATPIMFSNIEHILGCPGRWQG